MKQPWDFQAKAIDEIYDFYSSGGLHCILQSPTGTGKTVIFCNIIKRSSDKGKKCLVLTDREELLDQTSGEIVENGMNPFIIKAGCKVISNNFNVYVAMTQTLRNRIKHPDWIGFIKSIDFFIIDECHRQDANYLLESGLIDNKYLLGLSATPWRVGKQRQLGYDYEKIITTISTKEAIDKGFLVSDDYFSFGCPDLSNVKRDSMSGDFQINQMFSKFNTPKLYKGVVESWLKHIPDTKTIVFCVNIEHSIKTCIEFNNAGVDAKFIVSKLSSPKLPKNTDNKGSMAMYDERMRVFELYNNNFEIYSGDRKKIFQDHKNFKFPILINSGIATTGYDDKSIQSVIENRATMSRSLHYQMIGRGGRALEGKTHFNYFDFGGNCERLGYYTEKQDFPLYHKEGGGEGLPPLKNCGYNSDGEPISKKIRGCNKLILASSKICPKCGYKYPDKELETGELLQIMYDSVKHEAVKVKKIKEMTDDELYEYFKIKKHKTPWLWRQLWYRGREKKIKEFGELHEWDPKTIKKAIYFCLKMKHV